MAIKFVLVEIVLVETVLVGDPLYYQNSQICTYDIHYQRKYFFDIFQTELPPTSGVYRGSPTSTVSTSTISTSTNFIAIGIKLVLVELLCSKVSTSGNWLCSIHYLSMRVLLVARSKTLEFSSALCFLCRKRAFIRNFDFRSR